MDEGWLVTRRSPSPSQSSVPWVECFSRPALLMWACNVAKFLDVLRKDSDPEKDFSTPRKAEHTPQSCQHGEDWILSCVPTATALAPAADVRELRLSWAFVKD